MQTSHFVRGLTAALVAIVAVLATSNIAAAQDDLAAAFDAARENFRPVSQEELAEARDRLKSRMQQLERFVNPNSRHGRGWLRYLRWNDFTGAIDGTDAPSRRALAVTYQRLNRDQNGLELGAFRNLASALERYMQLLQIASQDDQQRYYDAQLDRLREQLDEYRNEPTNAASVEIGSRLAFIESLGGADKLVEAVRSEFAKPNAFMDISTQLLAEGADPINRSEPVTDCILGTFIRSDTFTTGRVGVRTLPSKDRAIIEFISNGHTFSRNHGTNGPAVIRSTADTNFTATKRVELTDPTFKVTDSHSSATTDTHLQSVSKQGGGLGSRLVSRIGWNRARQSESQAERIAADHAEDRINRRFNDELNDKIRDARQRYEEEYRRPLIRRGALPKHILFSSDRDSVNVEIAQTSRNQLGAPMAPPEPPSGHDMSMRLHGSAVNNYTATLLGGATATQNSPDEDLDFDVPIPDWMKDAWQARKTEGTDDPAAEAEPFKPYSLRFRDVRPVSVDFNEGNVRVTIHIARLQSGDEVFNNWDVTGVYTPELSNGGIILRREGDLEMFPANFRGELTPRQTAERSNLEKELNARSAQGRGFPKTVEFESLKPDEAFEDVGPLEFNQFNSDAGWLTVAWDRQKK